MGKVDAHTSYPILRHHSIISGIAVLFMSLPDFLIASTIAKLLCSVLRAATASYDIRESRHRRGEKLVLAYCICAACHYFGRAGQAPGLGERSAKEEGRGEV